MEEKRMVLVDIPEDDINVITYLCGQYQLTLSEVLTAFIQDLIGGEDADDNSIGPANRYFKGRWSPPDKDSIFNYLDKEKKVAPEDLLDIVDLICLARKEIQNYREHPNRYSVKYFDAWKVELEESMKEYHEIMDDYLQSHEKRKVESELKYLAKWCKEKETVKAK